MAKELWMSRQEAELIVDLLEENFKNAGSDSEIGADYASELREIFGMVDQPEMVYGGNNV